MKKILFLSILILLCTRCSEKMENITNQGLPELASVDELKSLLPAVLQSSGDKYAIYKDVNGAEQRIKISVSLEVETLGYGAEKYKREVLTADYNSTNTNITNGIRLLLSANVYGDTEIKKAQGLLVGHIGHINPLGIDIAYDYAKKSISQLSSSKLPSIQLFNKTFTEVFISDNADDALYKELRFNFKYGIVSFIGSDGKIYVFDRFEP